MLCPYLKIKNDFIQRKSIVLSRRVPGFVQDKLCCEPQNIPEFSRIVYRLIAFARKYPLIYIIKTIFMAFTELLYIISCSKYSILSRLSLTTFVAYMCEKTPVAVFKTFQHFLKSEK